MENACASNVFAFRDAGLAIHSGEVDVALGGGSEVISGLSPIHQRFCLGVSGDTEWERLARLTFRVGYAAIARRHMHDCGTAP